jgi:hypothetical protein
MTVIGQRRRSHNRCAKKKQHNVAKRMHDDWRQPDGTTDSQSFE